MSIDHLATMVNDIAAFFDSESDRGLAAESVCIHLKKYWDPRMRRQIVAHLHSGGAGLSELARAGVVRVAELDGA